MTGADVTIVVLNWNRADDTIACLASLDAADLRGASVLVVDNGSRDGSLEKIRAQRPETRIIALAENLGYAGGNNAGIRAALADGAGGVLLLNNDTRVASDFLPPLLEVMNAGPRRAGVCSAVHRLDRPELLDVAFSEIRWWERHVVQLRGVNALASEGFDRCQQIEVAVGCSLLMSADALRELGVLDEAYFAYHEDVDWCVRARRAGWELFYQPFSRVYHRGSASTVGMQERPPPLDGVPAPPALANAEPMPWNPVRAYLGARNVVRLLRSYASTRERRAFARDFLGALPLEFMATVLGREGWMRLGRWSWTELARVYFMDRHGIPRVAGDGAGARLGRSLRLGVVVLFDVLWCFPRDVWRAWRSGRLRELGETLRGLRDGVLDRPLPLVRLGLREPVSGRGR
jgi:GT2 family glycosyltransferase